MPAPQNTTKLANSGVANAPLYRQVMGVVTASMQSGTLRPGDRLPSLRKMSEAVGVSIPTVQQAYVELERQRRIESRPRRGFFVRQVAELPLVKAAPKALARPSHFGSLPLVQRVFAGIDRTDLVPLGIANPTMVRPATKALNRAMRRVMPGLGERMINYSATLGEPRLRRQLAYYFLDSVGVQIDPDSICIANGGQEALLLALSAVAAPGDIIAVESPTYHGMLELIDSLGMLALEIETCPEEGINRAALEAALKKHEIKACLFCTTLNNPLGVTMPENDRREMLGLLGQHNTVLIEDDVYGELRFDGRRPVPSQFLTQRPRAVDDQVKSKRNSAPCEVVTCGSFSKTVAPGYRIGWVLCGSFHRDISRLKRSFSCTSGLLPQLTLAELVASGDYSRHLVQLRAALQRNAERMSCLIENAFPAGTRVSKPHGGGVLWVEMPGDVDSEVLFERAIEAGVSTAPGAIFSPGDRYRSFLRLGFGHPWDEATERALVWLGREVGRLAD